jgi:ATP-dependent RNA helicase DDX54/DBP10
LIRFQGHQSTSAKAKFKEQAFFNMPHRASSPAVSENEFDITKSLFKDDVEGDDEDFAFPTTVDVGTLDAGGILDLGLESDGDRDAEFIAAKQAASNRKNSNVKGKSVKKGGGFQSMGRFSSPETDERY